jgi:hypothetical protein
MNARRSMIVAILGAVLLNIPGCDRGAPVTGSRAIVAAHYLEKQRARIQQMRTSMKSRSLTRSLTQ